MATKTSYRLLGEGNFIDSTGIVHERIPLNELLDKFAENVSYYQKFGFETWKCYQYANKNL